MTSTPKADVLADLSNWLRLCGPYLDHLVLVGGFAPLFYRAWSGRLTEHPLLRTHEVDWAVEPRLPTLEGGLLADRVAPEFVKFPRQAHGQARFDCFQRSSFGTESLAPSYVELIAPLRGGATDRQGMARDHTQVQSGVYCPLLPYVDLLLHEPIVVDASNVPDLIDVPAGTLVKVAAPLGFVLQKALIRDQRKPAKRKGDLTYVYDVALVTQPRWAELRKWFQGLCSRKAEWGKWARTAERSFARLFKAQDSTGPIEVVSVIRDHTAGAVPTEQAVLRVVQAFLQSTLGSSA